MKRLFTVRNTNGYVAKIADMPHSLAYHITHPSEDGKLYFDNKKEAKLARDHLNEVTFGYNTWHISRGLDHMGKHGDSQRIHKRKERGNAKSTFS